MTAITPEERLHYVGASESATLVGHGYKSYFDLWAEKCGIVPPENLDDNKHVKSGELMEPIIVELAKIWDSWNRLDIVEEEGGERTYWKHNEIAGMGCSPDCTGEHEDYDKEILIDIKNTTSRSLPENGRPSWYVQVLHQAACAPREFQYVGIVAFVDGWNYKKWIWDRDDKAIAEIERSVAQFWQHVLNYTENGVKLQRWGKYGDMTAQVATTIPANGNERVLNLEEPEDSAINDHLAMMWECKKAEKEAKKKYDDLLGKVLGCTTGESLIGNRFKLMRSPRKAYEGKLITEDMVGTYVGARKESVANLLKEVK